MTPMRFFATIHLGSVQEYCELCWYRFGWTHPDATGVAVNPRHTCICDSCGSHREGRV